MINILLGSQSPRRKELIEKMGFNYRIIAPNIDECWPKDIILENIPVWLSEQKSIALSDKLKNNELLLTADTIVILNNKVLNKPQSKEETFDMLKQLSNNIHYVVSGVTLLKNEKKVSFNEITKVQFNILSDKMIQYYIDHGNPMDKAGAYGIQDYIGIVGIKKIDGCYYNVMGLPTSKVFDIIHKDFI